MKQITRTLVQCTTIEDARRIEKVLIDRGFNLKKCEFSDAWEIFEERTMLSLDWPNVGFSDADYYLNKYKEMYSQYNQLSAESFLSLYDYTSRRNRIRKFASNALLTVIIFLLLLAVVVVCWLILSMLPTWATIAIEMLILAFLSYRIVVKSK